MSAEVTCNKVKYKNKKKKKNSRFLHNAKGFGKKGIFGRGTHIEDDEYQYFINVLDSMKNGFGDIEEKVIMANNVLEQTKEREVYLASNQIVCKVMESLIGFVEEELLETYFKAFGDSFRPICSDRFASHVLQKMVEIAFLRFLSRNKIMQSKSEETNDNDGDGKCEPHLAKRPKLIKDVISEEDYNLDAEFSEQHKINCGNFVLRVSKFMLNNLEDFVWDLYASHIMRSCILCLAGIHMPKVAFEKETTLMAKNQKNYEVPSEWHDVCKEFAQRLEMWPQFSDFPYKETSSALLSVLCVALKAIDKKMLKHFGKKILRDAQFITEVDDEDAKDNQDENKKYKTSTVDDTDDIETETTNADDYTAKNELKLPKVFQHKSSIVLLETLITVAGHKLFTRIYETLFINKLAALAKGQSTNFAVTKLLAKIKVKEEFENIFDELHKNIEDLLRIGHTALVTSLSSGCLRFQTKQAQLIAALQSALHLSGGDKERLKSFFMCLLKLKPYEIVQEDKTAFVHLNGSLLIQDILRFNKPIFMVNCMLETAPNTLVTVFNTPNGSYICDAFLQSTFIGEKSRDKLLKHLENFYVDLATTKFGSRVLESCYKAAQDAQKEKIVKELAHKINILKSTQFGGIINQKLRVETYRLSPEQWKTSVQKNVTKAQELFGDIIN